MIDLENKAKCRRVWLLIVNIHLFLCQFKENTFWLNDNIRFALNSYRWNNMQIFFSIEMKKNLQCQFFAKCNFYENWNLLILARTDPDSDASAPKKKFLRIGFCKNLTLKVACRDHQSFTHPPPWKKSAQDRFCSWWK